MLLLQNADVDEEAELNTFCVTCGIELSPRVALRHMEKCFNKVTYYQCCYRIWLALYPSESEIDFIFEQEYVLWNAVSVPLLQFARYCSIVQTLSLKYIATLTLKLHDVVGHLIIIRYIQFPIGFMLYRKWHKFEVRTVPYSFNHFGAISI